ncbi:MAG: inositol monophosphatase [Balneolaceae bacterium]|nr:inositol monophosphatase [Balneolaceae bacterium]
MNLAPLKDIAIEAALAAGKIIKTYMDEDIEFVEKADGGVNYASQVVTKVDKECEDEILKHLIPTCKTHDLALLTEETEDNGSRFEKDYFWCIDPIDGTLAFIKKEPDFSVSIALVAKDGTPVIGVVYDPSTDMLYHGAKGHGVYKNDELWEIENKNNYLTFVHDKSLQATHQIDDLVEILNQTVENHNLKRFKVMRGGGSVLNAINVLHHAPACLIKHPKKEIGGGSLWDFAATACLFHELGYRASNFDGGPLDLNRKDSIFMHHEGVYYASFE